MSIEPRDRPITRLLLAHQTAEPDAFVETLATAVAGIGGRDVVLLLIDYAQVALTPHPDVLPHASEPQIARWMGRWPDVRSPPAPSLAAERDDGWHVWVPVSEQSNRLGVLAMILPRWDEEIEFLCTELGLAAAPLLLASAQYTDLPHLLRRRKDMDLAAEMQWSLLPPLSFAAAGVTIAGMLEPAYQVGGDCFDYAFNAGRLDFAVLDTVGHGLTSAVLAALLVGAYRHGRREGDDLEPHGLANRRRRANVPGPPAFATGILGRLEAASGRLSWLTCGHALPIVVRDGTPMDEPRVRPGVPMGMGAMAPVVGTSSKWNSSPVTAYSSTPTASPIPGWPMAARSVRTGCVTCSPESTRAELATGGRSPPPSHRCRALGDESSRRRDNGLPALGRRSRRQFESDLLTEHPASHFEFDSAFGM